MSVLLVLSEFLKQKIETRKVPYSTTFVDHTKHPSVKNHFQVGHLKAILTGKGGGGILNEAISCCLIEASESK